MKNNSLEIFNFFGDFSFEDLIEYKQKVKDFEKYCVSIYDHWLDENEYQNKLYTYHQVIDEDISLEEYIKYEKKYLMFFTIIYEYSKIYTFDNDFDIIKKISLISSKVKLKEILSDCLKEKRLRNCA